MQSGGPRRSRTAGGSYSSLPIVTYFIHNYGLLGLLYICYSTGAQEVALNMNSKTGFLENLVFGILGLFFSNFNFLGLAFRDFVESYFHDSVFVHGVGGLGFVYVARDYNAVGIGA